MKYEIDGYLVDIVIEKKKNKNTYIRVKDNNTILITTNFLTTKKSIISLIENNKNFIVKNLKRMEHIKEKEKKFFYLGNEYNIIVMPTNEVSIIGNNIYTLNEDKLNKWLNKNIKILFKERLDNIYSSFEEVIPYPKLRIRKMKTRWGVCNRKDVVVTLNSELIKYDVSKLDYVIVHELSHFIHFNHSSSFWNLVSKYCPDYKKIRKELRD